MSVNVRLPTLQMAVLGSVLQLASPAMVFADEEEDGVTLEQRTAELVRHRGELADAVLASQIQHVLVKATERFAQEDDNLLLHLVTFLTSLHHPAPHLRVNDVEAYGLSHADTSSSLAASLRLHALPLWCLLARAPATLAAGGPLHFLRAAADLSFFAPPPRQVLPGFLSVILASKPPEKILAALCVIAANAGALPHETPLAAVLDGLPEDQLRLVAGRWQSWRGPVKADGVRHWSTVLGQEEPLAPHAQDCPEEAPPQPRGLMELVSKAPAEFRCVLDGQIMLDPVRTPQGLVFERLRLAQALAADGLCPCTGEALALDSCVRLPELRRQILGWVRENAARQVLPNAQLA
ncbi:unnamed protein product [Effrenium voratum]|nr:unnamed protein product [Effrenium voratum]